MSKELEAFRNGFYMREENNGEVIYRYRFTNEDIDLIEKAFKALAVIKDRFEIQFAKSDLPYYYGIMQIGIHPIYIKTKKEFDLLKEVLL